MNPNSPEDRLLDELLHEQSRAPDEAFLKQIEAAVDARPSRVAKHPGSRNSRFVITGVLSIAAAVAVVAGGFFWTSSQSRHSRPVVAVGETAVDEEAKAALALQELSRANRDQEDKIEERRKVLAAIAARSAGGENVNVLPSLIGKLKYVKDESRAWVLRLGFGVEGKFPFKYEDSTRQTNNTGAANMVGPGDSFFLTGPMANRFKLLGAEVRREMIKAINVEREVTIVRVEDQWSNKKGVVYEFPSPLAEQRKNEFLQYDRTAVFTLQAAGMEETEFKVEENTAFSLPPGGEKKDYLLKLITPAGVVVEMVDGGQTVEISKGAMPAVTALAALAANSAPSPRGDIQEGAIKRGLDGQAYAEAKNDFAADETKLQAMRQEQGSVDRSGDVPEAKPSTVSESGLAFNFDATPRGPRPRIVPPAASVISGGNAPAKSRAAGNATFGRQSDFSRDAAHEGTGGDRYGKFIDQPWKSPAQDPLSTFSIDVDTASYSNVRRMIQEGREIPKDAVRIEEFINAFKYSYATPKGDGPFAVSATLAACPWAPTHQLVRVAIKGREIETHKRPASNLVFLIDVSGSMQSPDKLPLLKQSMATLVEQLDERDRVAIVVYAGTEGVALPSTRLDAEGRAAVLKALGKLEAGGSTNGGAGIKRAYELAMKEKAEGGVNRVILASDGDFNVGVTGQDSLVGLVKDRAKSGVYLTVLGFGTGNLNDAMMDAITRDGNGNYFYIDSGREGRKVFLQNLSGTLVTIAKDVKIQVEFNPAKVGSYRLIGYSNRVLRNEDFHNDKVDAGDIGAGHTVTAFYELTPPGTEGLKYQSAAPAAAATDEWLTVKLRHKHPDGDESRLIEFPLTGEIPPLDKTDADFQFATAAALCGMKLRGMDEVRDIGWEKVLELAKPGLANDATVDRAEFVGLVKKLRGGKGPGAGEAEVIPVERDR